MRTSSVKSWACLVLLLALASEVTPSSAAPQNTDKAIDAAAANAFKPSNVLTPVASPGSVIKGGVPEADIGTWDYLDDSIRIRDYTEADKGMIAARGLRQIFEFENKTDKPIRIEDYTSDCICTVVVPIIGGKRAYFPQTVKPSAKIQLLMAVDYGLLVPGKFETAGNVIDEDEKPLANMRMRGYLKPGITFRPVKVDLGQFPAAVGASRNFQIHLDRRVTKRLPPGIPLYITSNSENVSVKLLPLAKPTKQVTVKGNEISFNLPSAQAPLDSDLDIQGSVSLAKDAPLGPKSAEVSLRVRGMPIYLLLKDADLPVSGTAQGSMEAAEYVVVPPSAPLGGHSSGRTLIHVLPPATMDQLQVGVEGKFISARLVPIAPGEMPPATPAAPTAASGTPYWLEITTGEGAPIGPIKGKVIVTNLVAKDRLEIRVFSAITK